MTASIGCGRPSARRIEYRSRQPRSLPRGVERQGSSGSAAEENEQMAKARQAHPEDAWAHQRREVESPGVSLRSSRAGGSWLARTAAWTLAFALLTGQATAEEPRSLAFSAGVFNFSKSPSAIEAGIELRQPIHVWKLVVAGGLYGNEDGGFYGFGGLRRDFSLGHRWWLTPGFGVALYEQGDSKDLGGLVEFRSAIEIGREWSNRSRLALAVYHLSNSGIYDTNPGSNSLILTFSFPLGD